MSRLVLLEPELGPAWAPFAGVRPVAELRAGAFRVWERWQRALGAADVSVLSPGTPHFADVDSRPLAAPGDIVGPAIVARSDFAPLVDRIEWPTDADGFAAEGRSVGWIVPAGARWTGPVALVRPAPIAGLSLGGAADLVTACERLLEGDCAELVRGDHLGVPAGSIVLGDPAAIAVRSSEVEPMVIFDTRKGPVVLETGVMVRAGTRLEGPLWVGPHTWMVGGQVRHSVIGPHCRVSGEVSHTVFVGYGNKSHDGFVGHSILGHWVNLGAGTITSNLKNTYGTIRLDAPGGRIETGRGLLGSLIADHAKTAIGTLLSTGTIVGAGANVIGNPVPRAVRPFQWDATEQLSRDGFVTIARRVMPRRGVEVTPAIAASLAALHERMSR